MTKLQGVTAMRLEALADARLPQQGPGRAESGNFVLTELELLAAPQADPGAAKKVPLQTAVADFSQDNYDVKTAIDGNTAEANNGWAVHPQTGVTHWATFELKGGLGFDGPARLTFKLDQRFTDKKHTLGRFRISVTTAKPPVGLSLPQEYSALVAIAPDQRTAEQKETLLKLFRTQDARIEEAAGRGGREPNRPLPPDAAAAAAERASWTAASQPCRKTRKLARLRSDLTSQRASSWPTARLTAGPGPGLGPDQQPGVFVQSLVGPTIVPYRRDLSRASCDCHESVAASRSRPADGTYLATRPCLR